VRLEIETFNTSFIDMNPDKEHTQNIILTGSRISPGMAMGRAFVYQDILQRDYELYDIEEHQVAEEHRRIEQAIEEVRQDLQVSANRVEQELNTELAEIFRAQEVILSDVSLLEEILEELQQELVNAEYVMQRVLRRWERKFRIMEDVVLRQRADDMADLNRRLLRALQGIHAHILENLPENTVLVAKRLLPSDTVFLSGQSTVAVVVEYGGPGSHAALLTRALGIPAVGQIPDVLHHIQPGDMVLIDGSQGTVIVSPDANTLISFERRVQHYQVYIAKTKTHCHKSAKTLDGLNIEVMANITCREDAEQAFENGADGIGLYRLESFYLSQKIFPSEQDLLEEMEQTLMPVKEKPMTVRLLDIGGDKELPFLHLPSEGNPFLGRRGIRLLLEYPDLLDTQLKAMVQLSRTFDVRILVPMVTFAEDMERVRDRLCKAAAEFGTDTSPPLGAMIETPAAALCVERLLKYSDFFSIGTNDLTQYTMAAGRENPLVSNYFRDDHPAVVKLLQIILNQVGNTPVSLCGELAGNTEALSRILGIGLRSLSVPPFLVSIVKESIRNMYLERG
jgi:phosphotransferase system enzyme I (PtsI)